MTVDGRLTLLRDGLARRSLEGVLAANAYGDTKPMQVCAAQASVYDRPDPAAEQQTQLLFGEVFDVLSETGDFALGQGRRDGYVGFVPKAALSDMGPHPTHWICVPQTFGFASPDIKSAASGPYSLNCLITVTQTEGRFLFAQGLGWIVAEHVLPIGMFKTDFVATAEGLLGACYLWGGRISTGLDCSGLVQQALLSSGVAFPRDTDQQLAMGHAVEASGIQRGDLVFWRGHVGVMVDTTTLIHANAHHMMTAQEPLADAISRIAAGPTGDPVGYRRL